MFKKAVLVLLATAFGLSLYPWDDNPMRYVHWVDRFKAVPLGEFMLGRPCVREIDTDDWDGEGLVGENHKDRISILDESPNCLRYLPSRNYRGIWQAGFESSAFIELGDKPYSGKLHWRLLHQELPDLRAPKSATEKALQEASPFTVSYLIEFKGRRTKIAGSYGHMGARDHQIWVDDMITIKPLPDLKLEDMQPENPGSPINPAIAH